jgi:hypothetical protein
MATDFLKANFNVFNNSVAVITNSTSGLDYFFRYRVVSDEGEAVTDWSKVTKTTQNNISTILNGFYPSLSASSVESGGVGMNVKWTTPNNFPANRFDIYFSWSYDNGGTFSAFEYADTVTANNYYINIPTGADFVKVAVQIPTSIKIVNVNALLYQSNQISTLPILDSGTIS